ncbi:Bestrophin-4 [Taenia crassiceps]|uniref:Bestrophin homolog n=1 Tax=Taenia crassiceps TaxID=6207 RepID=A0ABR4Q5T1_9CEST
MAISYSSVVATASYGAFFRLLCRWKGSIYKLIWVDLLVFSILYSTIALVYHLSPISSPSLLEMHKYIRNFLDYVKSMSNSLPISFILGFFVTLVVNRWIDQFNYLPTSDGVGLLTCAYIQIPIRKSDQKGLEIIADEVAVIRQSIARYVNLAAVLCFQTIAPNVRKVYENTQNYITSGLMTEKEHEFFGQVDPRYHPFYVPLMWAITIVKRAKAHGYIAHERHMNALIDEILKFRRSLFALLNYNTVPIPLVYTQVVNIGVYAIFVISLVGSQFPRQLPEVPQFFLNSTYNLPNSSSELPEPILYVPIFSLLEITFYLGWLKVAQSLLNPFGDDDEDFDLLPLMERNLATSLWMVDLRHGMPAQSPHAKPQDVSRQQSLSFTKPTDTLFFRQIGPIASDADPLSELLASAAQLDVPGTLAPAGAGDNLEGGPHQGSAAIAFERKESRRMSFGLEEPLRRTSSSMAAFMHLIRRKSRVQSPSPPPSPDTSSNGTHQTTTSGEERET